MMKKRLIFMTVLATAGAGFSDSVIVQWGEPGGDSTIVSSGILLDDGNEWLNYTPGAVISPTVGPDYYPYNTGRSPVFNCARSAGWGTRNLKDDADGDAIQFGKNDPEYNAMVVWENFLSTNSTLKSLSVEIRTFGSVETAAFRWVIKKSDDSWYASAPVTFSSAYQSFTASQPETLNWYEYTPRNTFGASAAISMDSVVAVGVFFDTQHTASPPQSGAEIRYFQGEADGSSPPLPDLPLVSFDTGYTIQKVRTGKSGTNTFIAAGSYEGTVLRYDFSADAVWQNELTGFMIHDLWCDDLTGDNVDEVLVAYADGYIYCLEGNTGTNLWSFAPTTGVHKTPMYAVCTVKHSNGQKYVACGGYDKNFYWLSAAGQKLSTVVSKTYSRDKPWGDDNWVGYGHSVNFLRPIPQSNGTDNLALAGTMSHMQSPGSLYQFTPLANMPYDTDSLSSEYNSSWVPKVSGDFRVCDTDGDGTYEFLLGSSGLTDQYMIRIGNDGTSRTVLDVNALGLDDAGYRVTQSEVISDQGTDVYFVLCGTDLKLIPLDFNTSAAEEFRADYAFNDMWKDPASGKILLASAQSGGSCIHIINPSLTGWKSAYENLNPPGKIQTIKQNIQTVENNLAGFTAPAWEREPIDVYLPGSTHAVAQNIEANYDTPVFMGGYWHGGHVQTTNWRANAEFAPFNPKYLTRLDTRNSYDRTQQQVLNDIQPDWSGEPALDFWGGHGNDPNYYEPATLRKIIDMAAGRKTCMAWPELSDTSDDFKWELDHIFYPLADYCSTRNGWMVFKSKDIFWNGDVYLPLWNRLLSGEFADVFQSSMEETTDKTQDLSISGRIGLWAAGSMNQWGMRTSRDNPSFDRARQHSYQRLPNHFLRATLYNLACGATYCGLTYVDEDHFRILWPLIAKGALFIPERDEIVSFNPVHLGMIQPDERYMEEAKNNKWTVFYDETTENANPMVFSHMNGSWPAAKLTDWDFSTYASGSKDRRQNFLPNYPNGLVLITPPQTGFFADTNAVRSAMTDYLHPMYSAITREFITDGRDYISPDGTTRYAADTYYTNVQSAVQNTARYLPVTVTGDDVAWVCAQTSPTHLRLTLVDGGYLNPENRIAKVKFGSVTPVAMSDVLDGKSFNISDPLNVSVDIPLGSFRSIDIEIAAPFTGEFDDWTHCKIQNGLTGDPNADFDGDGDSDLREYALGGDPVNPLVKAPKPFLVYHPDNNVSFHNTELNSANPGITYFHEWSTNLVTGPWNSNWNFATNFPSANPDYSDAERRTWGGDKPELFFRLKVTQP